MSGQQTAITSSTIIKTFPPPSNLSMEEPHIRNVFAKPVKHRGDWHLKFSCSETGGQLYCGSLEKQFIYDEEIHDYIVTNHNILGSSFSKYWKSTTNCILPQPNDVVYDREDRDTFIVDSYQNLAENKFVHPYHRDRVFIIKANRIEIIDTLSGSDITVGTKIFYLNYEYMKTIGNLNDVNIKNKISKQELFGIGDSRMHRILTKKLVSIPKPTKRTKKVNASDDFHVKHWTNYLGIHLQEKRVQSSLSRGVIKFKLRTAQFENCFPFIPIKVEDEYRIAYLDYFRFKVSLRTSRIAIKAVCLKKDKISGFIEGEDNIPNPF
eukprot:534839_1